MIKHLELRNFRKHEDLGVDFASGLTSIVGQNDAGKSTLLQAILFALFGVRATTYLSERLWREDRDKKSPCLVGLDFDLPGRPALSLSRSDNHAVLTDYNNVVLASGHAPVTQFIESALGLRFQQLRQLMYSPQGEAQQLLDMGATRLQKQVEDLAGITIIDEVLTKLGADITVLRGTLEAMEEPVNLEVLEDHVASEQVLVSHLEAHCETLKIQRVSLRSQLEDVGRALKEANKLLLDQSKVAAQRVSWQERIVELEGLIATLEGSTEIVPAEADVASIQVQCKSLQEKQAMQQAAKIRYASVLKQMQGLSNQGSEAEVERLTEELELLRTNKAQSQAQLMAVKERLESAVCPTCERPWEAGYDPSFTQQRYDQLKLVCEANAHAVTSTATKLKSAQDRLDQTRTLQRLQGEATTLVSTVNQEPFDVKVDALTKWLEQARTLRAAHVQRETALRQHRQEIERWKVSIAALPAPVELPVSIVELEAQSSELNRQLQQCEDDWQAATNDLIRDRLALSKSVEALQAGRKLEAQRALLVNRLNPRVSLQRYLRVSRTRHASSIWEGLLHLASHMIDVATENRITGVTRKDNEFVLLDGRHVDDLGGAMKSLVGLSLRIAMSRVFYGPGLPLLLDEPTADASEETAAAIAGMLRGLGGQVIFVTHRSGDQVNSDHIVEIL